MKIKLLFTVAQTLAVWVSAKLINKKTSLEGESKTYAREIFSLFI